MNKKTFSVRNASDVVFMPALAPLEASVIPAGERRSLGTLRHAQQMFRLSDEPPQGKNALSARQMRVSGRRSASNR